MATPICSPDNGMQRLMRVVLLGLLISLTSACSSCDKLLTAAQAYHQSVGAQYLEYVSADEKLSPEDKYRKKLNVKIHGKALDKFAHE